MSVTTPMHNHSMMNHSMMSTTHGMHHSTDGGGHGGHGGMSGHTMTMYFHFGHSETILFYQWKTSTWYELFGSCIILFLLAMLYEGFKVLRENLQRRYNKTNVVKVKPTGMGSTDLVMAEHKEMSNTKGTFAENIKEKMLVWPHVLQSVLHFIQVWWSYVLMLVFMTYNVWLCLAVGLGAGVGYFIFCWKRPVIQDPNEHCH